MRAVISKRSENYQNNRDSEEIQDPEIASSNNTHLLPWLDPGVTTSMQEGGRYEIVVGLEGA